MLREQFGDVSQDTLIIDDSSAPRRFRPSGFDLLVVAPDGTERRLPLCYVRINLGSPGEKSNDVVMDDPAIANRQATLQFIQGKLYLNNLAPALVCTVNGKPSTFRQLKDGDEIQIGGFRLRVLGAQEPLALLESYTDRSRHWPIGAQNATIGRRGKRDNTVELDHPTVSRTHACIHHQEGAFRLEAETAASPTRINGETVTVEQPRLLSDGDLIQIGQEFLRFRLVQRSAPRSISTREVTILNADIWDDEALAEGRPLEEVIAQLNEFYEAMEKVILAQSGVLMTFLGDAMMAVFGAAREEPEAPARAVRAALAMQERLTSLNQEWQARGLPGAEIGVGVHTGEVPLGEGGRPVTAPEDSSLAEQLEQLTREREVGILVSGSTRSHLGEEFEVRSLGRIRVQGRNTPVEIFQVLG